MLECQQMLTNVKSWHFNIYEQDKMVFCFRLTKPEKKLNFLILIIRISIRIFMLRSTEHVFSITERSEETTMLTTTEELWGLNHHPILESNC